MEQESILDRLPPVLRQNLMPISLGFLGLVLILFGIVQLLGTKTPESDVVFETAATSQTTSSVLAETTSKTIMVDVSGAVVNPGVYTLPDDARVTDAIQMAGGFHQDANQEWIAKSLNLASKLSDSMKIYVPFVGETGEISSSTGSTGTKSVTGQSGLININAASEAQLDTLPGIGPVTAQKIIASRPYASIEELMTKKAVGQSVFENIKEKISI